MRFWSTACSLAELSPGAALVLLAEMFYAQQMSPQVVLVTRFPKERAVRELLGLIGYFKYFPAISWTPPDGQTRFYLEHRTGEGVDRNAVRALLDHLRTAGKLSSTLLYEALTEGMQNATEWGYENRQSGYRTWWLLGYRDAATGEIAHRFYDQGIGASQSRFEHASPIGFCSSDQKALSSIRRAAVTGQGHFPKRKGQSRPRTANIKAIYRWC